MYSGLAFTDGGLRFCLVCKASVLFCSQIRRSCHLDHGIIMQEQLHGANAIELKFSLLDPSSGNTVTSYTVMCERAIPRIILEKRYGGEMAMKMHGERKCSLESLGSGCDAGSRQSVIHATGQLEPSAPSMQPCLVWDQYYYYCFLDTWVWCSICSFLPGFTFDCCRK